MITAMPLLAVGVLIVLAAALGVLVAFALAAGKGRRRLGDADAEVAQLVRAAREEAEKSRRSAELEAREAAHAVRAEAEADERAVRAEVARRIELVERREVAVAKDEQAVAAHDAELSKRENDVRSREGEARAFRQKILELDESLTGCLEKVAGSTRDEVKRRLGEGWIEEARAHAAARMRAIDAATNDPEHVRQGKRVMGIAIQRFHGHYLTERLLSNLVLVPETAERVVGPEQRNLRAIEELTGVKLTLAELGGQVRMEGLDGVAREVARRTLRKLEKDPRAAERDPVPLCKGIQQRMEQEIVELGKKAFHELEIPRAHADIVRLVGRLQYRTSYTQNQWKHSVEAGFLCGMIAAEIGADVKLARRAALLHDIGKSLTHELDGSHAIIGAEYARRLGELEIVANAIGAHHTEEPFNSALAYITAAADALSGGRPGARREQSDNYVKRLQDLERIAMSFPGVGHADAVGGGREVRVYVREDEVSDPRAIQLSNEIARKISAEMTFPGQIKVTVIRQIEAIEYAS
jgi:ribonuclease Y